MLKNTPKSKIKKWEIINNLIAAEIITRPNYRKECSLQSVNEERMFRVAEILFGDFDCELLSNSLILDLFEGDLVLKIPKNIRNKIEYLYINIEIDGDNKRKEKKEEKKRFLLLRDNYIVSKGIFIRRIKDLKLSYMTDDDLIIWLNSVVMDILKDLNLELKMKEVPRMRGGMGKEEEGEEI